MMITWLLQKAIDRPGLMLLLTLLLAGIGGWQAIHLPVDAVPDITNVQVQINTAAPGFSPLETEQRISTLIETGMAGLPQLEYSRSLSRYALSQVTLVFAEGTDLYWARQQVSERLQSLRAQLPAGVETELGPLTSGLGEILAYRLQAEPGARKADGSLYSAQDLRTLQDWTVRPQLLQVTGVTEVNTMGGSVLEYQVAPDPARLMALKITLTELAAALERNNSNIGAGYIERNGEQWLIRSPGQLSTVQDIAELIIAKRDLGPVRVKDVATVQLGSALRTGAATQNGEEVVLGTVMMLQGANSRTVALAVAEKLSAIRLPAGISAEISYNRTGLVDATIATVRKNLLEGAVLVIVILLLFLRQLKAALITAAVIPLSMLFAISGMAANKVSANLMSLGAIDFGLMVDCAVIVVENCLKRLAQAQQQQGRLLTFDERRQLVLTASREVLTPAWSGVLIIMLVYLPLFALSGVEGKMFHPMAFTVMMALAGAMLLAFSFVPAALVWWLRGPVSEQPGWLFSRLQRGYQPLLRRILQKPAPWLSLALLLLGGSTVLGSRLGTEFMPQLDEGDVALHAMRITGTSLSQSVLMQQQLEKALLQQPEVLRVFSKIGTPEVATDPMPPNVADTFVILKARADWPEPAKSKTTLVQEMRQRLSAFPGNNYEFTQPIEMRFNELIAGVRADVAIRLYGDDLATLTELGQQLLQIIAKVPGAADARLEQQDGLPLLSIEPEREHLALLGLDVAALQQLLQTAVGGQQLGLIYQGDQRFALMLRLPESLRQDPTALGRIPIALPTESNGNNSGQELNYVPLADIATLRESTGPSQINRYQGKRHLVISANIEERDLGSFVAELQQQVAQVPLPAGYWLDYAGSYQQLVSAQQRLQLIIPFTLLLIFLLLYQALNSVWQAMLVLLVIPFALAGGVLALWLREMPLSISALVGFIALSGIAVLNGIVLLSAVATLRAQGMAIYQAVWQGAQQRLRPVLMTALVASLGFVPMAFNLGIGAEVQRPLATVVIGGILSATILTLLILPALYLQLAQRLKPASSD
jgi:cobalt-zinc-cadmium resistance protein CzcA